MRTLASLFRRPHCKWFLCIESSQVQIKMNPVENSALFGIVAWFVSFIYLYFNITLPAIQTRFTVYQKSMARSTCIRRNLIIRGKSNRPLCWTVTADFPSARGPNRRNCCTRKSPCSGWSPVGRRAKTLWLIRGTNCLTVTMREGVIGNEKLEEDVCEEKIAITSNRRSLVWEMRN